MIGQRQRRGLVRWAASGAAVLCGHAAVGAILAGWSSPLAPSEFPGGAVFLDLATIVTAPETSPEDVSPGPNQVQTEASPQAPMERDAEKVAKTVAPDAPTTAETRPEAVETERDNIEPMSAPEAELIIPLPQARPQPARTASQRPPASAAAAASTSAPEPAARLDPNAAAPSPGRPSPDSAAVASWKGRIVAILERNKHYPPEAEARRERGVAQLSFSIDRSGRVVASQVTRSSGSAALDRETLALVRRAQPFPAPPRGFPGEQINLTVPISFKLR